MTKRDYTSSPVSETLNLDTMIRGLSSDLEDLRAGRITTNDAIARSLLAKQIFNGARLYMQGMKLFSEQARPINAAIAAGSAPSSGYATEQPNGDDEPSPDGGEQMR